MLPFGYLYKKTRTWDDGHEVPEEFRAPHVREVCSISSCNTDHPVFDEYPTGLQVAPSPEWFADRAKEYGLALDLEGYSLFYYEMYERQFDEEKRVWRGIFPEELIWCAKAPAAKQLLGYDAAVYQKNVCGMGCSPLSCNCVAAELPEVNEYCLFKSLEELIAALDRGAFDRVEPGPYRVFSVYRILG